MSAAGWTTAVAVALSLALASAHAGPPQSFRACAACHLPNAQGVPGAFPPLAGRVGPIATTLAGRRYLVGVVSFGLSGEIVVGKTTYRGFMPAQSTLSASDVATVLNYLATESGDAPTQSKFKPFTAAEVEQLRKTSARLTPSDVGKSRPSALPVGKR
ncbi:c-type cytochrome [Caulobacter sp. KR2-114]|uniref:c-type cytochrome n=1 Tax=Caulobacter sp. KR2-114 TaxID=3400912 RepID=UPI003C02B400